MRYLHEKSAFVLRVTWLSLLLAAQSLSLTHELDHIGLPDSPQCAVCSLGGSLSGPIVVEHEAWDPTPRESVPVLLVHGLAPATLIIRPPVRAPPLFTPPTIA